jgi:hypothetical protein
MANDDKSTGIGIAAGVLGALAALGGIAAAASGGKKPPLRGARPGRPGGLKKPCGCGR